MERKTEKTKGTVKFLASSGRDKSEKKANQLTKAL